MAALLGHLSSFLHPEKPTPIASVPALDTRKKKPVMPTPIASVPGYNPMGRIRGTLLDQNSPLAARKDLLGQ